MYINNHLTETILIAVVSLGDILRYIDASPLSSTSPTIKIHKNTTAKAVIKGYWRNGKKRKGKRASTRAYRNYRRQFTGATPDSEDYESDSMDGPTTGDGYNPNDGYEPYWPEQEWETRSTDVSKSTRMKMCLTVCPQSYIDYGPVCGSTHFYGYSDYRNFNNICELRDMDCNGGRGSIKDFKMVYKYSVLFFIILKLVEMQIYRGTTRVKSQFTVTGAGKVVTVNPNYNPNEGYQPYWPGGNWVFTTGHTPPTNKNAISYSVTPKLVDACGIPCNYLMAGIGPICARWLNGTWLNCDYQYYGRELCKGQHYFVQFDNYCHYLAKTCQTDFWHKMVFEYVGECYASFNDIYKPVHSADLILGRLPKYWADLDESLKQAPAIPKWMDGQQVTGQSKTTVDGRTT